MNRFEKTFFKKHVSEWQEIIHVFHRHWIKIVDDIVLWIGLGVLIPVFLYYNSFLLQEHIEFKFFEIYLFLVYIIIIYKVFDWYNDVLILTKHWVTRLEWSIFKSNAQSVDYTHIEWLEVDKNSILDTFLRKWDVKILKFWDQQIVFSEANKPKVIVNKIEEITSNIEHPEELTKFDMMMDALWWIVENYLWKSWEKRVWSYIKDENSYPDNSKDLFEDDISNYNEELSILNRKKKSISKELKKEFLEKVETKDGTIDLR